MPPAAIAQKKMPPKRAPARQLKRAANPRALRRRMPEWSFRLDRDPARVPLHKEVAQGVGVMLRKIAIGLCAAVIAWSTGYSIAYLMDQRDIGLTREAVNTVVERIVAVESSGDANAKNPRSTATGAAQFIEATWLELIRKHRSDLRDRPEAEILDLRRDPKLSRELTARFIERNARVLRRYGHAVTPGNLYLSHFAGGAGAVAILSAQEHADAALTLANADSTGKISREKLVKANPFLEGITAGGLRRWADRKMNKVGTRTASQATRAL